MTSTLEKPKAAAAAPARTPAAKRRRKFNRKFITSWIAVAVLLAVWQIAPNAGWVDKTFLPPLSSRAGRLVAARAERGAVDRRPGKPAAILDRLRHRIGLRHPARTADRLVSAWRPSCSARCSSIFLNTAAIALLPVFTLILGIGETSKVAIILYASIWPILYNTISGVRNVDPLLIKSARSLGLSHIRLFQKVILPASVPTIFTGVRLGGAASILVLITTEMVGAKAGLGYLILNSQYNFQIPDMYAGILTVSAIGVAFNYLLLSLERRFSTWRSA